MRLIDADLLRAEFTGDFEGGNTLWHYTGIWAMIDCAPTAYDIEKVVEQLEELKETAYESYGLASGAHVAMCNAIGIVKRGGAE